MSTVNPYGANQGFENQTMDSAMGTRSMVIRRVDPVSFGKIFGGLYAIFGLIWAGFAALMLIGGVALAPGAAPIGTSIGAALFGLIILPVLLGIFGFAGGAIGAVFFNIASGFVGGVKIDVEA
jgi:hypothetical protein